MRLESKLCYISENKTIVQVSAWVNEEKIGSALAEGTTVELAEDKAISRLNTRLKESINSDPNIKSINNAKENDHLESMLPKSKKSQYISNNDEPSDWSNELIAIDSEIKRLEWNRDDEIIFLKSNLGYNNRNKITKYTDIVKYLNLLKNTNNHNQSEVVKNINILIEESDSILKELKWDHIQGRQFLLKEFNVSTRKELNEKQLTSFVGKLKSIRNEYSSHKASQ